MIINEFELNNDLEYIKENISYISKFIEENNINDNLLNLEKEMLKDGFWDDMNQSKKVVKEINNLKNILDNFNNIKSIYDNIIILIDFIKSGETEFNDELNNNLLEIKEKINDFRISILLNGKYDNYNAIVSINSGAGGTESFDFVNILFQMYQKWANKHNFKITVLDYLAGDTVGFKNISFLVEGDFVYGLLKSEKGVHRLIRISPFDSNGKRHTTFAAVNVVPEIENELNVEIRPEDIEIDTFRASGAGGQHVNTTNSAVRIKHLKTGIIVTCQNERSQLQNKEFAIKLLKSKLVELEIEKQNKEISDIKGKEEKIEWGSQIRSYIMQPYELVKDHRTKFEKNNVSNVFNGDIDDFSKSYLEYIVNK